MTNTERKKAGTQGVILCMSHFNAQGNQVSLPVGDHARYDLVVELSGKLWRVQCKLTNRMKRGLYPKVDLMYSCSKGRAGMYTKNDFDFLWVVTPKGNYFIPARNVGAVRSFFLYPKWDHFKVSR